MPSCLSKITGFFSIMGQCLCAVCGAISSFIGNCLGGIYYILYRCFAWIRYCAYAAYKQFKRCWLWTPCPCCCTCKETIYVVSSYETALHKVHSGLRNIKMEGVTIKPIYVESEQHPDLGMCCICCEAQNVILVAGTTNRQMLISEHEDAQLNAIHKELTDIQANILIILAGDDKVAAPQNELYNPSLQNLFRSQVQVGEYRNRRRFLSVDIFTGGEVFNSMQQDAIKAWFGYFENPHARWSYDTI